MDTALNIIGFKGFDAGSVTMIALALLALCISAILSGAEKAFFSISPDDVQNLRNNNSKRDKAVLRLTEDHDYLSATIAIAGTLASISFIVLSNIILGAVFVYGGAAAWGLLFRLAMIVFALLLFGQIIPRRLAAYNAVRFARFAVLLVVPLRALFKPLSYLLIRSGNRGARTVARRKVAISMEELSDAIEMAGAHNEEDKQILNGIVGFVNKDVQSIMKPRLDMVSVDIEAGFDEVKRVIITSGFSRIPVYAGNLDNIKGMLYVKDMLRFVGEDDSFEWRTKLRGAYFIPENKKINDLLEEFRQSKVHIAVVVDEYGSTQGLVSLEDILEEVVGEIADESDMEEASFFMKLDDRNYIFDGKTHLTDFGHITGLSNERLDELRGDAETLAGLMIEVKGDFLRKGESVFVEKLKLTVDSMDGRRIDKVHVKIL